MSVRFSGSGARQAFVAALISITAALPNAAQASDQGPTKVPMAERVAILQQTYPDLIYSVTNNVMRLMSNRHVLIDDGQTKTRRETEHDADVQEQLSEIYPTGRCFRGRKPGADPGILRAIPFLKAAYGANLHQVKRTSRSLDWFGSEIRFSTRHGAADALLRVRTELRQLPAHMHEVLKQPQRALDWSEHLDTERLSVHAFGIAIELSKAAANSWRGPRARRGILRAYENKIHPEIVEIFERHGFIWGGKWHHFNTAHFEYRPELIAIGRLAEQRGCESNSKPKPRLRRH